MIKLSLVVSTDAKGGVSSEVKNESRDITPLERSEMARQHDQYLAVFKLAYDRLLDSIPSKTP